MARAFLHSPLAGIAPWVVMSLVSGPGRSEPAVLAALGLSVAFFLLARREGDSIKLLEIFDLVFFAGLAIVGAVVSAGATRWLELWAGELTNIALAVFAFGSMLVRVPFTLQYAKEQAPQEVWDSPLFLRVNYMITGAWALAFAFCAVVGFYGDAVLGTANNFWTGWVLQIGALVFAVSFTEWYPDYAPNKAALAAGEQADPPRPVIELFGWLPTFLLVVGIIGLVTDAVAVWLGIALIVVGAVGWGGYRRVAKARLAG
ncbi:hypothetical protein FOS14_14730 [Skermania sp. ID1734]|nr:hypothetical protein FOS14_14730 [Skermania sp. ID1734]